MNFLKSLLESIEYDLLLSEGKDPVEVLHYKFQNKVPENIIDKVISIDPTKKKSYSQWLLNKWDNEKNLIVDGLKSGRIEKLFQHMQQHKDVQLQAYDTLAEPLNAFAAEEDTVLTKSDKPTTILMNRGWKEEVDSDLANDFNIVFNEDDWIIAVPNTYEADCKLGENMNWCTAGGRSNFANGRYYYDRYLSDDGGRYYVNFDMSKGESRLGKDYPYTRYQFHFESKQFMDKEDEPVEVSEIGMPDSAMEFYEEEGYDSSYFENDELKYDRYMAWREENCTYRLNDDLYLCIEFDEDYEQFDIDGSTDFYLFSNDDDRDPTSWETFWNPFADKDVVVVNKENYVILKRKVDNEEFPYFLATSEKNSWGYNSWEAYTIGNYLPVENVGIFAVMDDHKLIYIPPEEEPIVAKEVVIKKCQDLFLNKQCSQLANSIFIEAVDGEYYHSLFKVEQNEDGENSLSCVIYRDGPINNVSYEINEKGLIEGKFKTYRAFNNDRYDANEQYDNYQLMTTLPDGNYLVQNTEGLQNVVDKETKRPIAKEWFPEYINQGDNIYVTATKRNTYRLLNIRTGEFIDYEYARVTGLEHGTISAYFVDVKTQGPITHFIDSYTGEIKAHFKTTEGRPVDGKIVVQDFDSTRKVFNFREGTFQFQELSGFKPVGQKDGLFLCTLNNGEGVLFNLSAETIVAKDIKDITNDIDGGYHNYFVGLKKNDGTVNVYDEKNSKELLPNGVEEIFDFNEYHKLVNFISNEKFFIYNYETGQFLVNKDGIDVSQVKVMGSGNIMCADNNIPKAVIIFYPTGEFSHWRFYNNDRSMQYREGNDLNDKENTPQEVFQLYAKIFNTANTYTMAESFKQLLKRINEVKL